MQGAVSTALELPTTRRPRTNRLDRAVSPAVSAPIELSHEIHPVAFLDLTSAPEVVEDVVPRDRSEALCRAVELAPQLFRELAAARECIRWNVRETALRVGSTVCYLTKKP